MDLYEITHIPTNMKYVGITYKENKTYLDRFYEHINGDGSVEIMRLMETGSTIDDFSINLICNVNTIDALYGLENMFISHYKNMDVNEIIQHKPYKKYYLCDNCGTEYYNKGHIINHQRKCKGTSYV